MMPNKVEKFEDFLLQSFGDGIYSRELRLSKEEKVYVQKKYPNASMKKCLSMEASDGKCWYEINLLPPISFMKSSLNSNELAAVQQENNQLKRELESLKKTVAKMVVK